LIKTNPAMIEAPPLTGPDASSAHVEPQAAVARLADLGFLAVSDLPDQPGPAYLLVAIRPVPTLRHFDPEAIEYWVNNGVRGARHTLTGATKVPIGVRFSWGLIRIVDRLTVTNEFLAFGGWLAAERVGDSVIVTFTSPAPLLRRGGHSQGWDTAADSLGAFFGRFLVAVDFAAGFEQAAAAAQPLDRYAAFVADGATRYRASQELRAAHPEHWALLRAEEQRLRATNRGAWIRGEELLHRATG
jgi:hypothetical protein